MWRWPDRWWTDGAILLDVRDSSEHQLGHIPGAMNVPLCNLAARSEELRESGKQVVVCCQSSGRASMAISVLSRNGVCGLFNLGSIDRWDMA